MVLWKGRDCGRRRGTRVGDGFGGGFGGGDGGGLGSCCGFGGRVLLRNGNSGVAE